MRKTSIICYIGAISFACIRTMAVSSVVIFTTNRLESVFETIIMSAIFTSTWAVVLYILGELTYLMLVFGASTRLRKIRHCLGWVYDIYNVFRSIEFSTLTNNQFDWPIAWFYRQQFLLRKGPTVQLIEINSDDSIAFVKRMGELYENMCEIVDDINGIFSIHVRVAIFVFN